MLGATPLSIRTGSGAALCMRQLLVLGGCQSITIKVMVAALFSGSWLCFIGFFDIIHSVGLGEAGKGEVVDADMFW